MRLSTRYLVIQLPMWVFWTSILGGSTSDANCNWPLSALKNRLDCTYSMLGCEQLVPLYQSFEMDVELNGVSSDIEIEWLTPNGTISSSGRRDVYINTNTSLSNPCWRRWTLHVQRSQPSDVGQWKAMIYTRSNPSVNRTFPLKSILSDHPTEKCDSVNDPRAVCQNGGFCFFDPNCCKINGTDCEQANCGENGNPFICQCPPGYHGYRCEISCEPVNPIRNGSTVTLVVNESCPLSYISEPCAAPFKWWPGSPPNSPLLLQMAAVPRELSNTFTCSENRTVVVVQYPPEIQPGRGGTECMTNQIPCGINEGVSFSPTERYLWEIVSTTPGACGTCKHNYSQSPVTNESLFNGTPSNVNCYRQLEQKPFEFQLSMCEGDSNPAACYRCSVSSVFGSLHRDIGFIPPTDPCHGQDIIRDCSGNELVTDSSFPGIYISSLQDPQERFSVQPGQTITLVAKVANIENHVYTDYQWYRNGSPLNYIYEELCNTSTHLCQDNSYANCYSESNLTINSFGSDDVGQYTVAFFANDCSVRNQKAITLTLWTPSPNYVIIAIPAGIVCLMILIAILVVAVKRRPSRGQTYRPPVEDVDSGKLVDPENNERSEAGPLPWKYIQPLSEYLATDWMPFLTEIGLGDYRVHTGVVIAGFVNLWNFKTQPRTIDACRGSFPSDITQQANLALLRWYNDIRPARLQYWTVDELVRQLKKCDLQEVVDLWQDKLQLGDGASSKRSSSPVDSGNSSASSHGRMPSTSMFTPAHEQARTPLLAGHATSSDVSYTPSPVESDWSQDGASPVLIN